MGNSLAVPSYTVPFWHALWLALRRCDPGPDASPTCSGPECR